MISYDEICKIYQDAIHPFYVENQYKPITHKLLNQTRPFLTILEYYVLKYLITRASTKEQLVGIHMALITFKERNFMR